MRPECSPRSPDFGRLFKAKTKGDGEGGGAGVEGRAESAARFQIDVDGSTVVRRELRAKSALDGGGLLGGAERSAAGVGEYPCWCSITDKEKLEDGRKE